MYLDIADKVLPSLPLGGSLIFFKAYSTAPIQFIGSGSTDCNRGLERQSASGG